MDNGCVVDISRDRHGRKRISVDFDQISRILLRRRTNIRSLSMALEMAKSTVHRRITEGSIKAHSNRLKPYLTEENKKSRLMFCTSIIDQGTVNSKPTFTDIYDCVHIDEKWFYMSKTSKKYYLHPLENEPLRTCKNKRFIEKVIFLVAVARPRITSTNQEFLGKIGIFPFNFKEPAKRNSKNRIAGTLETKAIKNVTKDVIRKYLIEKILPSIREKWPENSSKIIYIQIDNAKPHISVNDDEFLRAGRKDGFDIRLSFQPSNSPDLSILDLGFFRAIQILQHQQAPTTIDELILAVEKSYNDLPSEDLNCVFLTLKSCMVEIMKVFGGFDYKIPHMNKNKLKKDGRLPIRLECDPEVFNKAMAYLQN
ncbi:uncharacterized protein LOC126656972 [Mercurialis annua]|uniref:uncharacterized protein LOC126656972 n=1 Tax=Mercurialis annua TaxID=3986 RepID=UPI00215F3EE5|nr:uncharacterized protein LOC126656972 [Mercurialis annua]